MYDLTQLAGALRLPEPVVMETAALVLPLWKSAMAEWSRVNTLDVVEATAMLAVLRHGGTNPVRLLEVGTQFGVSACILHDGLEALGIQPLIRTYDVRRESHLFKPGEVDFRCEDITDRCGAVLDEFMPHAVFLDAHPWHVTYNLTVAARQRGLIIFMHDISDALWAHNLQSGQLPLQGHECDPNAVWERKVLETVFGPGIHAGHYQSDDYVVDLIRSRLGVAICRPLASGRSSRDVDLYVNKVKLA